MVDLLSDRLSGRHVAGVVVLNAHRVTDTSGEGFAVRLFRAANSNGFVRAFSDQPVSFLGFSKVLLVPLPIGVYLLVKTETSGQRASHSLQQKW